VSPVQQELQIWTGGTLNIIKLIVMNSTFAQILGKLKNNKMSENLKNFENLTEKKESKFSLVLNPLTSQKLDRCSRPLRHRFC
jgi:hypothetical protein